MKLSIVLLGVLFCLGAPIQAQTSPSAKTTQVAANHAQQPAQPQSPQQQPPQQPPAAQAQQSLTLTGCVDERNGHYVLRDEQSGQLLSLQAPGSNDDSWFAKYLGHKTQVSGTESSGTLSVTSARQVADMCGPGK